MKDFMSHSMRVASCPHLATCRSELRLAGKEVQMPLPMPSPDYIGPNYRGLVIIGSNPGLAHTAAQSMNDRKMFALQEQIALGSGEAFRELMRFLPTSMLGWKQVVDRKSREYLGFDISEVAYVNLVKCATNPGGSDAQKLFTGTNIVKRCWKNHTGPLLELLRPTHIAALWKPVIKVLGKQGYLFPKGVQVGFHSGRRSASLEERYATVRDVFQDFSR